MSIIVIEHDRSGPFTVGRGPGRRTVTTSTRIYKVWRTEDGWAVRLAVFEGTGQDTGLPIVVAPVTDEFGGLRLNASTDKKGNGVWEVKVEYGVGERQADNTSNRDHKPNKSDGMGMESSFDIGGGTVHLTQSYGTIASRKKNGDTRAIPNYNQAIGVSEHGVAGVEVDAPKFAWTETWKYPAEVVTWQYAIQLRDMCGKVNDATFRNADQGEVKFKGASGQPDGVDYYRVTYKFECEKNRQGDPGDNPPGDGIVIAPGWDPIDKNGWDYLWCTYEADPTQTAAKVQVPRNAYVERVCVYDDFTKIGIGS